MTCAVNARRSIFDVETHPAEFEDSRTVLQNSQGKNFRQGNPATRSSDQQHMDSPALRLRKSGSAAEREAGVALGLALAGIVELCFTAHVGISKVRRRQSKRTILPRPSDLPLTALALLGSRVTSHCYVNRSALQGIARSGAA